MEMLVECKRCGKDFQRKTGQTRRTICDTCRKSDKQFRFDNQRITFTCGCVLLRKDTIMAKNGRAKCPYHRSRTVQTELYCVTCKKHFISSNSRDIVNCPSCRKKNKRRVKAKVYRENKKAVLLNKQLRMRRYDCAHYDECLIKSIQDSKFRMICGSCRRYSEGVALRAEDFADTHDSFTQAVEHHR